jgi:hypothetical protein
MRPLGRGTPDRESGSRGLHRQVCAALRWAVTDNKRDLRLKRISARRCESPDVQVPALGGVRVMCFDRPYVGDGLHRALPRRRWVETSEIEARRIEVARLEGPRIEMFGLEVPCRRFCRHGRYQLERLG